MANDKNIFFPGPNNTRIKMKLTEDAEGNVYFPVEPSENADTVALRGIAANAPFTSSDQSASAAAVTLAPGADKHQFITSVTLSAGATAQLFTLTEETSGVVIEKLNVAANSFNTWKPEHPIELATALNKRLMVQTGAAGVISVLAHYYNE